MSGAPKPSLTEMPRTDQRQTFLYLEHCKIQCEDSAVKIIDKTGIYLIPSTILSVLLLGPGTEITHKAIMLIDDSGMSMVWVGEKGIRYYASGSPLTRNSIFAEKQASLFSNQRSHLKVAKKMYSKRFDDDVEYMTIQQLRGIEGSRMKKEYQKWADYYGVSWSKRIQDFEQGDLPNKLISVGTSCLYGLAYAVTEALGMSPALGFIHKSHSKSFILDLADIYKTKTVIPLAFELAAKSPEDAVTVRRKRCRDQFREMRILEKMVADLQDLFELTESKENFQDLVEWWDSNNLSSFRKQGSFHA